MKNYSRLLILILISVASVWKLPGQNNPIEKELVVGIRQSPPFVTVENGQYDGLSIDLWEHIAKKENIKFTYRYFNQLGDLIDAIENEEIDLSVNPITVTSKRLEKFDFTQPYFISSLAIARRTAVSGYIFETLKYFFSWRFFEILLLLFIVIFIFGLITWFAERRKNPTHFDKGLRGLGDGIWWSAVTMTTVGYGDKAPKTAVGRFVSIIWMFIAVVIISSFTASISSVLTYTKLQNSISSIDDLRKVKVGTVKNSSTVEFLHDKHIKFNEYDSLEDALDALNDEKLMAVVYDQPLLQYMIDLKDLRDNIDVMPSGMCPVYYAFASKDINLLRQLDPMLIRSIESEEWNAILSKYKINQ